MAALCVLPLVVAALIVSGLVPYRHWMALLGIPLAGLGAIVFGLELPRLAYGQTNVLFLAFECASLFGLIAFALLLRSRLEPSVPGGFYRDVLDFLAVSRWHAAVTVALIGAIVLPLAHVVRGRWWAFDYVVRMGRRALAMGDVKDSFDIFAVTLQHSLMAGIPLALVFHLVCRRWLKGRVLPWLLLPLYFVAVAVGIVVSVTIVHMSR